MVANGCYPPAASNLYVEKSPCFCHFLLGKTVVFSQFLAFMVAFMVIARSVIKHEGSLIALFDGG